MLSCEQPHRHFDNLLQEVNHAQLADSSSLCPRPRRAIRSPAIFEPNDEPILPKPVRVRRQSSTPKMSKMSKMSKRQKNTKRRSSGSSQGERKAGQGSTTEPGELSLPYTAENYKKLYELSQNLVYMSLEQGEFAQLRESHWELLRELHMQTADGAFTFLNRKLHESGEGLRDPVDGLFKHTQHPVDGDFVNLKPSKRQRADAESCPYEVKSEPLPNPLDGVDVDELEQLSALFQSFYPPTSSGNGGGTSNADGTNHSVIEQLRAIAQQLWCDPFEERMVETMIRERNRQPRSNCKESLIEEINRLEEEANQLDTANMIALSRLPELMNQEKILAPLREHLDSVECSIRALLGKAKPTTPYRINERHRPSITAIERAEAAPSYVRKRYRGAAFVYRLPSTAIGTLVDAYRPERGLWTPAIVLDVRDRTSRFKDVKLLYCHVALKPLLTRIRKHGFNYPVVQQALSDLPHDCKWVHCAEHLVAPIGSRLSVGVFETLFTADEVAAGALDFQR